MAKVYLVGAGPGDPELITLKAVRILQQADVVIYDRLVSEAILAYAPSHAKLIFAGKNQGEQEKIQAEINDLLLHHAVEGKVVVRLKGGDPMVFGRGAEEWNFLCKHEIDVELIPGVTSSIAVPALAGIPLTCRGIATSFAVITGHRRNLTSQKWEHYRHIDTLVILMGVDNRHHIARALLQSGRSGDEPIAFIEDGSTDRQKVIVTTLAEVARGVVIVRSPAVCVIGQVVRLRKSLRKEIASGGRASKEVYVSSAAIA